jgi:hypothetical protein
MVVIIHLPFRRATLSFHREDGNIEFVLNGHGNSESGWTTITAAAIDFEAIVIEDESSNLLLIFI